MNNISFFSTIFKSSINKQRKYTSLEMYFLLYKNNLKRFVYAAF